MLQILRGLIYKGNCKYPCCFCLYDNYDYERHLKRSWPLRDDFVVGEHSVQNEPLINSEDIILPALHLKLGLVKQFVKYMNKNSPAFEAIVEMFPR